MSALLNHDRGYWCRDNVPSDNDSKLEFKTKVRVCNSETDSDSDCVRIGDRKIKGMRKQIDDNGNEDSSIYEDPNCDPRFSSCDTNSNEALSNTDSVTVIEESVSTVKKVFKPIRGSLAWAYAKRYGVAKDSDTEEEHCHGYDCPPHTCSDGPYGSCYTDPDKTSVYWSEFKVPDSDGNPITTDYSDSEVYSYEYPVFTDSCDSDEPGCDKDAPRKRAVALFPASVSSETAEIVVPDALNTSMSSNAASASASGLDSSSDMSADTESDGSAISEDLCANVIFMDEKNSGVYGWLEFYAPAAGHFAESVRISGNMTNLSAGMHDIQINQYGDLRAGCRSTGAEFTEAGWTGQQVRSS